MGTIGGGEVGLDNFSGGSIDLAFNDGEISGVEGGLIDLGSIAVNWNSQTAEFGVRGVF